MARIVISHSTYIEGLIPFLKKLSIKDKIQTITPGVISRVRGKSEQLRIRISCKTKNGFKLIARKGYAAQEIFLITNLTEEKINDYINQSKK